MLPRVCLHFTLTWIKILKSSRESRANFFLLNVFLPVFFLETPFEYTGLQLNPVITNICPLAPYFTLYFPKLYCIHRNERSLKYIKTDLNYLKEDQGMDSYLCKDLYRMLDFTSLNHGHWWHQQWQRMRQLHPHTCWDLSYFWGVKDLKKGSRKGSHKEFCVIFQEAVCHRLQSDTEHLTRSSLLNATCACQVWSRCQSVLGPPASAWVGSAVLRGQLKLPWRSLQRRRCSWGTEGNWFWTVDGPTLESHVVVP